MMDEVARRLAAGPRHFPHTLDPAGDRLLLIETDEAALADASFLDERMLTPATRGGWVAMAEIETRLDPAARDDAHYIFHLGHVGSTLVSRLLGRLPCLLSLREPLPLRTLAELHRLGDAAEAPWPQPRLAARTLQLRRLLARGFRRDQRVVVKTTSFVSDIAPALIAPGARAIALGVRAESYMATILAGENSRAAVPALTPARLARLGRHIGATPHRLWTLSEGERVALGWLVERLALDAAARALPAGTMLPVDFDAFLADPAAGLSTIARHLDAPLATREAEALARDPLTARYSKAPEHAYSAALRDELKQQALRDHAPEIARGLAWLDTLARAHPAVARVR